MIGASLRMHLARRWLAITLALTSCLAPLGLPSAAIADDPTTATLTVSVTGYDGPIIGSQTWVTLYRRRDDGLFVPHSDQYASDSRDLSWQLPEGIYRLQAGQPAQDRQYLNEYYPDAETLTQARDIVVSASGASVEIVLDPVPVISGRVVDSSGDPISGVGVEPTSGRSRFPDQVHRTDAAGRYRLKADPRLLDLGFEPPAGSSYLKPRSRRIRVQRADIDVADQTLFLPATLSGKYTLEPPSGGATVYVSVVDRDGNIVAHTTEWSRWGRGRYEIADFPPGQHYVHITTGSGNYAPTYHGGRRFTDAKPVTMSEGRTEGPHLVVGSLPAGEPQGVDVSGVVRDRAGRPLRAVRVRAYYCQGPLELGYLEQTGTDPQGRYYLTDLHRGSTHSHYCLQFGERSFDPGRPETRAQWSGGATEYLEAQPVLVPPTGVVEHDAVLSLHAGIRGTIRAASAGTALARGTVELWSGSRLVTTLAVGQDGRFSLRTAEPGPYLLRFSATARESSGAEVELHPRWWRTGTSASTAEALVLAEGQLVDVPEVVLDHRMMTLTPPRVTGLHRSDGLLEASGGTWNPAPDRPLRYQWFCNGRTPIGSRSILRVPASCAGGSIHVSVRASAAGDSAVATTAPTRVARLRSIVRTRVDAHRRRHRLVARVIRPGARALGAPGGSVRVTDNGRLIRPAAVLRDGEVTIVVRRPAKGRHVYVMEYLGSATTLPSSTRIGLRVR